MLLVHLQIMLVDVIGDIDWMLQECAVPHFFLALYNISRLISLYPPLQKDKQRNFWDVYFLPCFIIALVIGSYILYLLADLYYKDPHCELREALLLGTLIFLNLVAMFWFYKETNLYVRHNYSYLRNALICFVIGFTLHQMDVRKIFCNPTSLLQFHAMWHCLTAAALHYSYLHLRSQCRIGFS